MRRRIKSAVGAVISMASFATALPAGRRYVRRNGWKAPGEKHRRESSAPLTSSSSTSRQLFRAGLAACFGTSRAGRTYTSWIPPSEPGRSPPSRRRCGAVT